VVGLSGPAVPRWSTIADPGSDLDTFRRRLLDQVPDHLLLYDVGARWARWHAGRYSSEA
jgi:hypothetical protein